VALIVIGLGVHRTGVAHSDATITGLSLDATAEVPWWRPESRTVTLHRLLVHVATETHRHAGHADLVRELIGGQAGLRTAAPNLPDQNPTWWAAYRNRLQAVADAPG